MLNKAPIHILVSISFFFCTVLFETMPRRNDAWDHWYDDLGVSADKLQKQEKCKFYPCTIAYRADRMLAHLGNRSPQGGVCDVSICKMVLHPTKQLFENCGRMVPTFPNAILESVNDVHIEEVEELEPVLSQYEITARITHREPLQSSQSTIPSLQEADETPIQELCQRSLPEGFNASTKEILDKVWAWAFYKANIPFNVVKHPTFIHVVQETTRLRMPTYTPSSYDAVCTRLLTAERVDVEKKVEEKLGNSIGKYDVTIYCDGWDNVQNRPLLNVVQCGTTRDFFLGTINTTGNHKDHQYVVDQIRSFLEKVKVHNVIQVCTDNAPIMTVASRHILQSTSHLYMQGCAAHCLDLLMDDWSKEEWVKKLVNKAKIISIFIKSHHASQAIF